MDNNSLIRETLTKLEQTQIKLQSILEAQKAMESNIPYFFENNLNALKKFFPNLYKTFKDYKLKNNYKLTCGANGEPNILLPSGNLFYGDSPFNDCKKQVNDFLKNQRASFLSYIGIGQEKNQYHQMHYFYKNKLFEQANDIIKNYKQKNVRDTKNELESVPLMIMYGLGLGYHLSYLYEAFTPINLYIIEPDKDLFYLSLCVFDYASLIEYISNRNLGLKLIIDENENSVFRDLTIYTYRYSMNLAVKSFYTHYYSPSLKKIANLIKSEDSSFTIKNGFFDDTLIGMSHSYQNISNGVKLLSNKKLPEKYASIPILVVGSGPSLDYDLEFIKKINNKVCILACGTALTSLVKYGIMPNFYVAVERTPEVFDNSLGLIENTSIFDNVICFAPDVVHPNTIAKFKYKFLGLKTNEVMAIALKSLPNIPNAKNSVSLSHINPLVSNMGIVIATLLGFKNIYFVGIDNGSAFKEAHSIYSCYYDENHKLKKGAENMILEKLPLTHPGNFRDIVKTNSLFKISIHTFEEFIVNFKNKQNFYNASDGAKIEGTKPIHLTDIDWDNAPIVNHMQLHEYIINNMSISLKLTKTDYDNILRVERFNEVADTLINDLKNLPQEREEIILRIEQHIDFLNDLSKEKSRACSRALIGSLQLFYAGYYVALYYIQDPKEAVYETNKLLNIIVAFLEKAKELYPHAYEYDFDYVKDLDINIDDI